MAAQFYNRGLEMVLGDLDWANDTINALLVTSAYTFDPDHDFVSQITNEVTGGGYARQTLGTKAVLSDLDALTVAVDAADIIFSSLTATNVSAVILFRDQGMDSTSELLAYIDSGGFPLSPVAENIEIDWNVLGVLRW